MRRQFVIACSLLVLLSVFAFAQSGRKQKKTETQPPVQGVNRPELRTQPEPEPEPEKEKEKKPQRVAMVATDMPDMNISSYYPDMARRGCLEQLRELSRSIQLREANNQNRSDAMKVAKEGDETYVIWMEFLIDRMGTSRGGFELRYWVFEPKTAKIVASGTGFPQQPRTRVPLPPIGSSQPAVLADWAGRDVAEQVARKLNWVQ